MQNSQLLFVDLETTGLDPAVNAPISVGAVVLGGPHDGKHFQGFMRPWPGAIVNAQALAVNGYSYDQIVNWPDPQDTFGNFKDWLCMTHPEPMQVQQVSHFARFDESFLREWFVKHTDATLYGALFCPPICTIDVIKQTWPDHNNGQWPRKGGHKLTFQYEYHFGASYKDAHTELADCYAARAVYLLADKVSGRNQWRDYHKHIPTTPQ